MACWHGSTSSAQRIAYSIDQSEARGRWWNMQLVVFPYNKLFSNVNPVFSWLFNGPRKDTEVSLKNFFLPKSSEKTEQQETRLTITHAWTRTNIYTSKTLLNCTYFKIIVRKSSGENHTNGNPHFEYIFWGCRVFVRGRKHLLLRATYGEAEVAAQENVPYLDFEPRCYGHLWR